MGRAISAIFSLLFTPYSILPTTYHLLLTGVHMDLNPFKDLLKEKCGLFFDDEREATLRTAIETGISEGGTGDHAKYFNSLVNDHDEFNYLVTLLTINETYFFRESAHFDIFSDRLIPELISKKKSKDKIRILNVGCSTGEEPYSVAIALMERYGESFKHLFSVIGADIDKDVVRFARKGLFGKKSFRGVDEMLIQKYFKKLPDGRRELHSFVREHVEFHHLNLVDKVFPEIFREVDIIFYRNVSIYFRAETQREILTRLAQLLNNKGYLFVSSTETFLHNLGILALIEIDGSFLFQKDVKLNVAERRKELHLNTDLVLLNTDITPKATQHKTKERDRKREIRRQRTETGKQKIEVQSLEVCSEEKRKRSDALFDEALLLAKDKRYNDALDNINKILAEHASFVKAYALKANILINLKKFEEAEKICLRILEIDRWFLEGYLLLGLIAKIRNNSDEAVKRFKEALYLQPSCWPAHYYLAEIYHSQSDLKHAAREYGVVIKLLEKGNVEDHGLTFFPFSFPAEQLMHLCRKNLNKLKNI
ncbi:MAG: CheR family methyltransferase [Candidatus Anammoxibacter sp.]